MSQDKIITRSKSVRETHPGKKIVIIIGGGFAGLSAAKELSNENGIQVFLLDRRNHHLFQPLLYQVASAGLNPSDIAVPIRGEFSSARNVNVHWASVEKIDLKERSVVVTSPDAKTLSPVKLPYDYLIVAAGASHSYFGNDHWQKFAPGLKTLENATEMRRRLLSAFENAENESDPEKQASFLTFVVIGGGPTGVELAGAIADIRKFVITRDFKQIDPRSAKVILIEAGGRVLSAFDEKLSRSAESDLLDLGVEVLTSTKVSEVTENGVTANGKFISTKCVFWAAGVQATEIVMLPSPAKDKAGRVVVQPDLSLLEFPEVFVVGDMASVAMENGRTVPGLAPAAIQEGRHAARMILARSIGGVVRPFHYFDKGMMATIGRRKAVMQFGPIKITGTIAWLGWLFVHILYLVGFKNRLAVFSLWVWSYLFSKRGARLITGTESEVNGK